MNYYTANGAIILPQFGEQKWDDEAFRVVSLAFPDHEVSKHVQITYTMLIHKFVEGREMR